MKIKGKKVKYKSVHEVVKSLSDEDFLKEWIKLNKANGLENTIRSELTNLYITASRSFFGVDLDVIRKSNNYIMRLIKDYIDLKIKEERKKYKNDSDKRSKVRKYKLGEK